MDRPVKISIPAPDPDDADDDEDAKLGILDDGLTVGGGLMAGMAPAPTLRSVLTLGASVFIAPTVFCGCGAAPPKEARKSSGSAAVPLPALLSIAADAAVKDEDDTCEA